MDDWRCGPIFQRHFACNIVDRNRVRPELHNQHMGGAQIPIKRSQRLFGGTSNSRTPTGAHPPDNRKFYSPKARAAGRLPWHDYRSRPVAKVHRYQKKEKRRKKVISRNWCVNRKTEQVPGIEMDKRLQNGC